jgi:hypothetical protein
MNIIKKKNKFYYIIYFLFMYFLSQKYITFNEQNLELNNNYLNIQIKLNFTFNKKINKKIRICIYDIGLKNGGRERSTSLLLNFFYKFKIFNIYLFTKKNIENNEFKIPKNIKRTIIKKNETKNLLINLKKKKIEVLIYQFANDREIRLLNKLNYIKVIYYLHTCFFYWVYSCFSYFISVYSALRNSKYVVSLVHLENDYLFRKWGINSIMINNFLSYEYNLTIPSNLLSKNIIMIGRADDILKRFYLGLEAMEYIIKEVPQAEMKIISNMSLTTEINNLRKNLKLENFIHFSEYLSTPEIFFKNASLHIFPTITESFGLVMGETKIFGIPNILVGLDYVSIEEGGTIMINDDTPESIAKESILILKNNLIKKYLGKEARKNMKIFKNDLLFEKWIKIILSVYNGDEYYQYLRLKDKNSDKITILNSLRNQIHLLTIRNKFFLNINEIYFNNFTLLENYTA